ncbi:hypothetical protein L1987_77923 [Smallanthus sonchifolius]|uniref:Uncharacterized protein n=1 Tax=Smallanthus sonchifolius TaxID=185202 RepID=A0ACB8ZB93_9ASTR|nr:hypothetical protein L1987_77923 [Smallanthus sonchifolius]
MLRKLMLGNRYFGKGREDGGPGEEEVEHADSLWTILVHLNAFCVTDYFPWLRWITDFDGHEKIIRNAILTARKDQDPLIDERIQQWKDGIRTKQDDLLDHLILAGFDNVSNNIKWVIAEMIKQPRILDKVVHELDFVVGKERLVQETDLPNLSYIKACVKEALRLHPVAPFNVPHVITVDSSVAGYFIPKGSHVIVRRNPEVWNDPLTFNPDRHLNSDMEVVLTDHKLHVLFLHWSTWVPGSLVGVDHDHYASS